MFGKRKSYKKEVIFLSDEEAKPLVLAAIGNPYFILVKDENGEFTASMSNGFNLGAIFAYLETILKENKDNNDIQSAMTNCIIELSKSLTYEKH